MPDGAAPPVIADSPGFGRLQGYHVIADALDAFTAVAALEPAVAVAAGDGQRDALLKAALAGTRDWNPDRAVRALHAAGFDTVDESVSAIFFVNSAPSAALRGLTPPTRSTDSPAARRVSPNDQRL